MDEMKDESKKDNETKRIGGLRPVSDQSASAPLQEQDAERHPEHKAGPGPAERARHGRKHRAEKRHKEPPVAGASAGNEDECHRLKSQLEETKDKYLRAIAELDNYRKRAVREQGRSSQMAVAAIVRGLLPVIDNFERALAAAQDAKDVQTLISGVKQVEQQIYRILQDHKIEEIGALNMPFDPHCHEVVLQRPASGQAAGTVIEVFERGFRIGDILIRAAKVAVAAPPLEALEEGPGETPAIRTQPPAQAGSEEAGKAGDVNVDMY